MCLVESLVFNRLITEPMVLGIMQHKVRDYEIKILHNLKRMQITTSATFG